MVDMPLNKEAKPNYPAKNTVLICHIPGLSLHTNKIKNIYINAYINPNKNDILIVLIAKLKGRNH